MADSNLNASARYYMMIADLKALIPEDARDSNSASEADAIEEITRAVDEISSVSMQLYTTT